MKQFVFLNTNIFLGEDKYENWNLLETSSENDLFVHLNSFPSGHVKIETETFNQEIILHAGEICKQHSKYKNLKNILLHMIKFASYLIHFYQELF